MEYLKIIFLDILDNNRIAKTIINKIILPIDINPIVLVNPSEGKLFSTINALKLLNRRIII